MKTIKVQQIDFSSVLFDTLFGLVLFFSIDSFLDIKDPIHFIFYLFSLIILVHWWLSYKSVDDAFGTEVTDSGLDIIIGITELVLIDYVVLTSRSFEYIQTGWFLVALLIVDLAWTIIWRYVGKWETTNKQKIGSMERELDNNLLTLVVGLMMFAILMILAYFISPPAFVAGFIVLYSIYIVLTFRYKIIDVNIF